MQPRISILSLIFFGTGCEVGLTTDEVKLGDTSEFPAEEPSSEPALEPSVDSNEPSTEPSTEPNDPDVDDDGDGFTENFGDCDDNDASIGPHASEIPGDDFDQNCDGRELCYEDADGDGFATSAILLSSDPICGNQGTEAIAGSLRTDCDDSNSSIYPTALDIPGDGIDQNCDGTDGGWGDNDNDGYDSSVDCDDNNASIHPGATEVIGDGIDQDCNGSDLTSSNNDQDSDGYVGTQYGGNDCDDHNPSIHPGATEVANDGIDQDCNGSDLTTTGGCSALEIVDCNGNCAISAWNGDGVCDSDTEIWNGILVDYNCASLNFENGDCPIDSDGDTYNSTVDCNDNDASIHPGATEIVNDGIDQDCDGIDVTQSVTDLDNDGYDATQFGGNDCNDNDASIHPGATEIPFDGIDQDCDGSDQTSICTGTDILDCNGNCTLAGWVGDGSCDEGGYSYQGNPIYLNCAQFNFDDGDCTPPDTDSDNYDASVDCNDSNASIHPFAPEIANDGIDQDCDGIDASYAGVESFNLGLAQASAGSYNCEIDYILSGNSSSVSCPTCDYVFDMLITPTIGYYDSHCTDIASPMLITYGFVSNYNGTGEQAVIMYDTSNTTWVEFVVNNASSPNQNVDNVYFDGTTFTYSTGYMDYLAYSQTYGTGFFSNLWEGSGSTN